MQFESSSTAISLFGSSLHSCPLNLNTLHTQYSKPNQLLPISSTGISGKLHHGLTQSCAIKSLNAIRCVVVSTTATRSTPADHTVSIITKQPRRPSWSASPARATLRDNARTTKQPLRIQAVPECGTIPDIRAGGINLDPGRDGDPIFRKSDCLPVADQSAAHSLSVLVDMRVG